MSFANHREYVEYMAPVYDLKDRTFEFANAVRVFVRKIPKNISNVDDCKQVVRSAGSIGANYLEADEAVSNADFRYRIKICRKEGKETLFWLKLLASGLDSPFKEECKKLIQECTEIFRIFCAILQKNVLQMK